MESDTSASQIDLSVEDEAAPEPSPAAYVLFSFAVRAFACSICLQAVFTLISSFHPLLELASHCSLHALVGGVVLLPLVRWVGDRGLFLVLGTCLAYLVFVVQPWTLLPLQNNTLNDGESSIKVLSWNVLVSNSSSDTIKSVIEDEDPDVVVLIEVRPGLIEDLGFDEAEYPTIVQQPSWGGEGIAVLSRVPGTKVDLVDFAFEYQPGIVTSLGIDGKQIKLVGLHTLSPVPLYRAAVRDLQIQAVCKWSERSEPLCICGDFNTTPWTRPFQRLLESGFHDFRAYVGNCPSWPASLGSLGIPIDHVLTKGNCRVFNRKVIRKQVGSDHFPVAFELAF